MKKTQRPVTGIPSPTLRVIGAGFGRTGTNSLRDALLRLGFSPCEKAANSNAHPERYALWLEVIRRKRAGEPIDWRPLLDGYRSILDWPGVYFWRELAAAHPEAKVILTVRDPDRWYDSARATLYARIEARQGQHLGGVLRRLLARLDSRVGNRYRTMDETVWNGTFGGAFRDRDHAIRVFEEHNREVQATLGPERLLVFDVKEGWEPLCAFLDVPVPAGEPFPHVNTSASFERRTIAHLVTFMRTVHPGFAAVGVGGVAGLALALRRLHRRAQEPATE
jgi:hypothetical protein